jgi:hypothetical protein
MAGCCKENVVVTLGPSCRVDRRDRISWHCRGVRSPKWTTIYETKAKTCVIAKTRRFIDNFQPGAASPKAASIILVETATLLRTLSITKAFSLEERSTYRKLNYVAGYTASSPTERTHTILAPIDIFQRQRGITIECVAVFCALVYSSARLKLIWNIIC